jgi:hypothetical protein
MIASLGRSGLLSGVLDDRQRPRLVIMDIYGFLSVPMVTSVMFGMSLLAP